MADFRLTDEEKTCYARRAGINVPPEYTEAMIPGRLLQAHPSMFTWGPDYYIDDTYGALGYDMKEHGFSLNRGPGRFNPIKVLAKYRNDFDPDDPAKPWVRASSPDNPSFLMKKIGGRCLDFLQLFAGRDYGKPADYISRKTGLSFHSNAFESADGTGRAHWSVLELKDRVRSLQPGEPLFGRAVHLGLDGFDCTTMKYRLYPNVFVNADIERINSIHPGSIVVEFHFFFLTDEGWEFLLTGDALTMVFQREDGTWKLCDMDYLVDLR